MSPIGSHNDLESVTARALVCLRCYSVPILYEELLRRVLLWPSHVMVATIGTASCRSREPNLYSNQFFFLQYLSSRKFGFIEVKWVLHHYAHIICRLPSHFARTRKMSQSTGALIHEIQCTQRGWARPSFCHIYHPKSKSDQCSVFVPKLGSVGFHARPTKLGDKQKHPDHHLHEVNVFNF